jgi:hypothetical protein
VIETTSDNTWTLTRNYFDGVEGWIDTLQHHAITKEYFNQINVVDFKITTELTSWILYKKSPLSIVMGSIVPISASELFKVEEQFAFNGEAKSLGTRRDFEFVKVIANRYLHVPFQWGGKSPFGIDAFALMQMIFKIAGYTLPRFANTLPGKTVPSIQDAKPGDLLYCSTLNTSNINHVVLLLEGGKVIHAYGRVRTDQVLDEGIVNLETKVISHTIHSIRRIF